VSNIQHIKKFLKLSLLDWPSKMAAVIFTGGCNFRCHYCHNKELVEMPNSIPDLNFDDIVQELKKESDYLDGVVITGGEPLLYDSTIDMIRYIKNELKMPVKLDTNGTQPHRLEILYKEQLLDYIAMDIKHDLFKYNQVVNTKFNIIDIHLSRCLIKSNPQFVDYEFRLTICPMIHHFDNIKDIANALSGAKKLVLQQFTPRNCLNEEWNNYKPYGREVLEKMQEICKHYVNECMIRGV